MTSANEAIPPDVLGRLSLKDIRTTKVEMHVAPSLVQGQRVIKQSHKACATIHDSILTVVVDYQVDEVHTDATPTGQLGFSATFLLTFQVKPGRELNPEEVSALAQSLGVFASWPYFRELLHNLAARSGLQGLVAPLLLVGIDSVAEAKGHSSVDTSKKSQAPTP